MRYILLSFLTLIFLTGCTNTPQVDPIVKIIGNCSNNDIIIRDISERVRADDFMQIQVTGENLTSNYFKIEYRVVWFDKNHFKIDSILSNWAEIPAYGEQPFYINAISPSHKAKSYRLYLKKEGNLICEHQSN